MNLSLYIFISIIAGAITTGIILSVIGLLVFKYFKKTKESELAKELKNEKQINYLIENIKYLHNHLQTKDS
ncbi:MAG: hypothetical protein ACRC1M_08230, partial [Methanobacteriaceae archaeon]